MPPRRPLRIVVVALATLAATLLASLLPLGAGASTHAKRLSDKACDGFADYFTIEFLVAFASAFVGFGADAGGGAGGDVRPDAGAGKSSGSSDSSVTPEEIQDIFHLIFSPKLEKVTALLAAESPPSIRKIFARQQAVFSLGVDILRDLGLTKKQLAELAKLDLSPKTDVSGVLDNVSVSKAKLRAAARDFGRDAGALDLQGEVSPAQQRAFQQTGSRCGVFPGSRVRCKTLVASDVSAPLVGGTPKVTTDQGSCTYTGPSEPGADEPVMIVDVYPTPRTYTRLVEQLQDPRAIDDDIVVVDGFQTFGSTKTCGKTLYSRTATDTIVVAVCSPGDATLADARLVPVRDAAATALAT